MAGAQLSKMEASGSIDEMRWPDMDSVVRISGQALSEEPYNDYKVTVESVTERINMARQTGDFIGIVFRRDGSDRTFDYHDISGFCIGSRISRRKVLILGIPQSLEDKISYLSTLAVDIRDRSKRIGRKLVDEYVRRARELGFEMVVVGVHKDARAVGFYLSLGFERVTRASGELLRDPERTKNIYLVKNIKDI